MGSRSGSGSCGSQRLPVSHRYSHAQPARRCSSGGWSCGCTWCHTLGRCHTRSAGPASSIPMDAAGHWHGAGASLSLLGQPSASRAKRTSSLLWSMTAHSGLFPVSELKCEGVTTAKVFPWLYQESVFYSLVGPLLALKPHFRGSWKLTTFSCLAVLLMLTAVHAEEGPAEPHDKAARCTQAPCGRDRGF